MMTSFILLICFGGLTFTDDLRVASDPIITERDQFLENLVQSLTKSDHNQDGQWLASEWPTLNELLPMLHDPKATAYAAWDYDNNGTVNKEEVRRGADSAYGIVDPFEGKWFWRFSDGRAFNVTAWQMLDKDRDRRVTREEFVANYYLMSDESKNVFEKIDHDHDGIASLEEFFTSPYFIQDVVDDFLRFDVDHDGQLTEVELRSKIEDWRKPLADHVFPQFDANGDGSLTFAEFRMLPLSNPAHFWMGGTSDRNGDGLLEFSEFFANRTSFGPLWLLRLSRIHFERFDRNHDDRLDDSEFNFVGSSDPHRNEIDWGADPIRELYEKLAAESPRWLKQADQDGDGRLTSLEWPTRDVIDELGVEPLAQFNTWDFNHDHHVTHDELNLTLRFAFGLTSSDWTDGWLRWANGNLVSMAEFHRIDADQNGRLSRKEFMELTYSPREDQEKWFANIDVNKDDDLTLQEMLQASWLLSPWDHFQRLNSDKDRFISQEELLGNSPVWERQVAGMTFPTFDTDGDGKLSMAEFRWTPLANPFMPWTTKPVDTNFDGYLNLTEFTPRPTSESRAWLTLFCKEFFQRWDRDNDGLLSASEFDFVGTPDSKLADAGWGTDPIRDRYATLVVQTPRWLKLADQDGNGTLSSSEWPMRDIVNELNAEPLSQFAAWDCNQDGHVTLDELNLTLRFALGLSSRSWPEGWLRWGNGNVVSMSEFHRIDADQDGRLSRKEFMELTFGKPEDQAKWFANIDANRDDELTLQEMMRASWSLSPWDHFQRLDSNKDKFITQTEFIQNSPEWEKQLAAKVFPVSDSDGDGKLSMAEFRWSPLANPMMSWVTKPVDVNNDGYLNLAEFTPHPKSESPAWLYLFCKEFFQRWDRDRDGRLSLSEYDFTIDMARLKPEIAFQVRDKNQDGNLSTEELFADPKPDSSNAEAVMAYQTRKMRSEEAFLASDKNADHRLTLEEYTHYETHLAAPEAYRTKGRYERSAAVPKAGRSWKWEEVLAYGFTGINLVLVVTASVYWVQKGRKSA